MINHVKVLGQHVDNVGPQQNSSGFGMREHHPVTDHKGQHHLLLEKPTKSAHLLALKSYLLEKYRSFCVLVNEKTLGEEVVLDLQVRLVLLKLEICTKELS